MQVRRPLTYECRLTSMQRVHSRSSGPGTVVVNAQGIVQGVAHELHVMRATTPAHNPLLFPTWPIICHGAGTDDLVSLGVWATRQ